MCVSVCACVCFCGCLWQLCHLCGKIFHINSGTRELDGDSGVSVRLNRDGCQLLIIVKNEIKKQVNN